MHSIFWKIFVSFWLAMVLIISVAIFASFRLAELRNRQLDEVDRQGILHAAAQVLNEQGVDGFRDWVETPSSLPAGMTIYLIDRPGHDVLERPLPFSFRHPQRRRPPEERRESHRRQPRGANTPHFVTPDGQEFRPMLAPVPPPVLGMLGVPGIGLLVLSAGMLISALVCYWLTGYLTRPLNRILVASRDLEQGKLDTRVGVVAQRRDEIGQLAHQFDTMAGELQRQLRSRQELFRNISHELRSPLARIQVALELAKRKPADTTQQLDRIAREADEIERLTQQVLDLVRAQSHVGLGQQPVDLVALTEQVVADARFEAEHQNKRVLWQPPAHEIVVTGDEYMLRSAIENVIRNAVRYTAVDTSAEVALTTDGNEAHISVCDSGPGVADDEIEQLFDPFFRAAGTHKNSGSGVGLAITAQGIALMGGRVSAANRAGGGLEVRLVLPLAGR